jgi:hypothetical protein
MNSDPYTALVMNIIDDFSSFVWSLSLQSKDEAASTIEIWLAALELHTSHNVL